MKKYLHVLISMLLVFGLFTSAGMFANQAIAASSTNLFSDDNSGNSTDFENNTEQGWSARIGGEVVTPVSEDKHGGSYSLKTTNRMNSYDGPSRNVTSAMNTGSKYQVSLWMKLVSGEADTEAKVSLQVTSGGTTKIVKMVNSVTVTDEEWVNLKTDYLLIDAFEHLTLFVETDSGLQSFYIDDFSLTYIPPTPIENSIPSVYETFSSYFHIGAAIEPFQTKGQYGDLLKKHFNSIVAENAMKWEEIEPTEGVFDFNDSDIIVDFATANSMIVRGHTLLWDQQTPTWVFKDALGNDMTPTPANKALLLKRLENHIKTVVEHFDTKVYAYDVVNEIIDESMPDGFRRTEWYNILGTEYIDKAFEYARQYAPVGTKLFINDYSTTDLTKQQFLYDLVADLKSRRIPVDGVGHQMHVNIDNPSGDTIEQTLEMFAALGVENHVTELDMSVYANNSGNYTIPPEDVLAKQGYRYKEIFDAFKKEKSAGNLTNVTIWGIGDDHTWLTNSTRTDFPLLFDSRLQAKYAYWGIVDPSHLPAPASTPVTGVSLDQLTLSLTAGGATATLIATVEPANATSKSVTWNSSNMAVATVNSSGVVTPVGAGTATITVTTVDGGFTATSASTVTVPAPETVHVNGVSIDQPTLSLMIGGTTATLIATVEPANATNKSVTWSSSDTAVATVNNSGVVTSVGLGTATITVTTVDGGFTATSASTVTEPAPVTIPVTGVNLNLPTLSLTVGGATATLFATVEPANATNKSVTWSSSDIAVAIVNNSGVVTPIGTGTATITVTTVDGGFTATSASTVTVPAPETVHVNGVSIDQPTLSLMIGGTTATLIATVAPANATSKSVTWSSSDTAVATVNNSGVVTPIGTGTATITVTTVDGGFTATSVSTVTVPTPETVAVNGVSLNLPTLSLTVGGSTATLFATVAPANATNKSVTWSSSDTAVATVNSSGVVTPVGAGAATITVTTVDGGFTATSASMVTVPEPVIVPVTGVSLDQPTLSLTAGGATATLIATVGPANATNKSVTWNSSNMAVATVNNIGVVTPIGAGTATITVTTVEGAFMATIAVTVTSAVAGGGGGLPLDSTPLPLTSPGPKVSVHSDVVTVKVTPDSNGTASVTINSDDLQQAISNAKDNTVSIQVESTAGLISVQVKLPVEQIKALGDQIDVITIDIGLATVTFDSDMLKNNAITATGDLELSVTMVDTATLPETVWSQLTGSPVYDFSLSVNGTKISKFNENNVKVSIGYTLKHGEDPNKVIVYFIDDNGNLQIIKNGKYNASTGEVEFNPKHFSKYAAVLKTSRFQDLGGVPWALESIHGLEVREIVAGVKEGTFSPNDEITRAQFIQMLMSALDLVDEQAISTFADVKAGAWYYQAIATAQQLGIVNGKVDGTYGINDSISRQEMAAMLYRAALKGKVKLQGTANAVVFTDNTEIANYAAVAITALQKEGVINGMRDGKFAPILSATRAEAAVMIYRLFNLLP